MRTNLPQRQIAVLAVRDDDLVSSDLDMLTLPTYDKIMLHPIIDKSFSPEELRAYANGSRANELRTLLHPKWMCFGRWDRMYRFDAVNGSSHGIYRKKMKSTKLILQL